MEDGGDMLIEGVNCDTKKLNMIRDCRMSACYAKTCYVGYRCIVLRVTSKHNVTLLRHLLNKDAANIIARSIVFSKLDYCNAVLYGVSDHNISWLQRVQNNLARVVCTTPYMSSVT